MDANRFREITARYDRLKVAVVGDFCLDRYLEIDPALEEVSLETSLPAHQVVRVRPQPGGAGTVLSNVAALGPAELRAVGVVGDDGEGYELLRALEALGANLEGLIQTDRRRTFTYTKPLVLHPDRPPEELSRLDIRDRTAMPAELVERIVANLRAAVAEVDVVLFMDQAPDSACGVLSRPVKRAAAELAHSAYNADKVFLADSRSDIGSFAAVHIKVNRDELRRHFAGEASAPAELARRWAGELGRCVFVTLGPEGIMAAEPDGRLHRVEGVRADGPIDIVGAGDAVSAHLAMALAAGASVREAITLANLAGSIVVRKTGTTGTASLAELAEALKEER